MGVCPPMKKESKRLRQGEEMEVKLENGLEAKQDRKNKGEVMSEEAKRFMG